MKIEIAKNAGFCFGVSRAVHAVYENIGTKNLCTYGEIVHNPDVTSELEKAGVRNIENVDDILSEKDITVVIRAHGVSKQIYEVFDANNVIYIDATCPYVKKIHEMVEKHYKDGYTIIIIGDKNHPEIIGINGFANNEAIIINDLEETKELQMITINKVCIVVQTTYNKSKFQEISDYMKLLKIDDMVINETICSATYIRQSEVSELSKRASKMIVVGGKSSSNTSKLYDIAIKNCPSTYFVENSKELDISLFKRDDHVGIVAGASTPRKSIDEVADLLYKLGE